jgi:hypothetical protein
MNVLRGQLLWKNKCILTLRSEVDTLQTDAAKSNDEICQTLGKVLGFPWYKDDLDMFPDATENDGVCIGDHVAETLAANAADRIQFLERQLQEKELRQRQNYEIERICSECNKAFMLEDVQHNRMVQAVFSNFENCPHCHTRNDVWIKVTSKLEKHNQPTLNQETKL